MIGEQTEVDHRVPAPRSQRNRKTTNPGKADGEAGKDIVGGPTLPLPLGQGYQEKSQEERKTEKPGKIKAAGIGLRILGGERIQKAARWRPPPPGD